MFLNHVSLALASIIILGSKYTNPFNPQIIFRERNSFSPLYSSTVKDNPIGDAQARQEYDAWRKEYNKGDYDEKRFEIFKKNYEAITIANEKAERDRKEGKAGAYTLIGLNEYADMSEEEFLASRSRTFQILPPENNISSNLTEGSDKRESDTMDSVEDLEKVLDQLDESEDDTNRIRSAYLDWCKQFSKESDETRFQAFSENYLQFETYFKEIDIPLKLNEYADMTKEEYYKLAKSDQTTVTDAVKEDIIDAPPEKKEPGYFENIIDTEAISSVYNKAVKVVTSVQAAIPEPKKEDSELLVIKEKATVRNETIVIEDSTNSMKEQLETEDNLRSPQQPEEKITEVTDLIAKNTTDSEDSKELLTEPEKVKVEAKEKAVEKKPSNKTSSESVPQVVVASKEKEQGNLDKSKGTKVPPPVLNKTVETLAPATTSSTLVNETSPPKVQSESDRKEISSTATLVLEKTSLPKVPSETKGKTVPSETKKVTKADTSSESTPKIPIAPKTPVKTSTKIESEGDILVDAIGAIFGAGLKPKNKDQSTESKPIPKVKETASTPKRKTPSPSSTKSLISSSKRKAQKPSSTKTIVPGANSTFSFFSGSKKKIPKSKEPSAIPKSTSDTSIKTPAAFSFFGAKEQKRSDPKVKSDPDPLKTEQSKEVFSFFSSNPKPKSEASDSKSQDQKAKPTPLFSIGKTAYAKEVSGVTKVDTTKEDTKPDFFSSLFKSETNPTETKKDVKTVDSMKKIPVTTEKSPISEAKTNITSSNSVSDVFGTLFGGSKKDVKTEAPTTISASISPTQTKSSFSFFSTPVKKAEPNAEPVEKSKSTAIKPKKAAFSFFASPEPKKSESNVTPTPVPEVKEKKDAFSFFSTSKSETVAPAPVPAPTSAPSRKKVTPLFGFGMPASTSVKTTPKPNPAPAATKPEVKKPKQSISSPTNVRPSGTFSISKALRNGMKTSIATITDFNQNADGSITGKVYNSKNFRDGTTITTSPVPKGAKRGNIVTTSSGTKYQLK